MNGPTIGIIVVLAIIVFLAIRYMRKNKSTCSCGCSSCHSTCHEEVPEKK